MLHSTWDLPRPGIEPVSSALADGLLSTAPPRKSRSATLKKEPEGPTLTQSAPGGGLQTPSLKPAHCAGWKACGKVAHCHGPLGEEIAGSPLGPVLHEPCQGRPHLPTLWGPSALSWAIWHPSARCPKMQAPTLGLACAFLPESPERKTGQRPEPAMVAGVGSR